MRVAPQLFSYFTGFTITGARDLRMR